MERLESDICACVFLGEMLDDLAASSFARPVADVAWLDYLARSRRHIDYDSWTSRLQSQELLSYVESTNYIGVEIELVVCCGDLSARNERVGCCDVENQDVDFANLFENGRDAVEVDDGRGVRGNFGVGIFSF